MATHPAPRPIPEVRLLGGRHALDFVNSIHDRYECGWLFVDDSRNNSRRWCSMELCGTAAKMRRYRRRRQP